MKHILGFLPKTRIDNWCFRELTKKNKKGYNSTIRAMCGRYEKSAINLEELHVS